MATSMATTGKRERGREDEPRKRARVSFAPLVLVRTEAEAEEACEHRAPGVEAETSAARKSVSDTSALAKENDGPDLVSSVVANLLVAACEGHLASPRAVLEALRVCLAVLSASGDGKPASDVHFVGMLLDRLQHLAARLDANGSVVLLPLDYCLSAECSRDCQVLRDTQRVLRMVVASAEAPRAAGPLWTPDAAASVVHA